MDVKLREDYVREFHEAVGLAIDVEPTFDLLMLRHNLILEEARETLDALESIMQNMHDNKPVSKSDWIELLDGMADLQYVLSGTAVSLRPVSQLQEAFKRVHKSNMTKLDENGKAIIREDGKVLKGPYFQPPYLADLVP